MKRIIFLFLFFFTNIIYTQDVWVNGYYRKDGTYVDGHYRTRPNNTNSDNFSTLGNINPYTYKPGANFSDGKDVEIHYNKNSDSYLDSDFINTSNYKIKNSSNVNNNNVNLSNYSHENKESEKSREKFKGNDDTFMEYVFAFVMFILLVAFVFYSVIEFLKGIFGIFFRF